MSVLSERGENVRRYYDETPFGAEVTRLKEFSPVEYAITVRHLRRRLRDATTVIEVGVGGGLYSEMLARQGHQLCLVDVSAKQLDAAVERLRACGLEKQIISVERVSATDLGCFRDGAFGAALMFGPFYHLLTLDERRQAVSEAWLDLIGRAETLTPDALGMADHFLYVGEKTWPRD